MRRNHTGPLRSTAHTPSSAAADRLPVPGGRPAHSFIDDDHQNSSATLRKFYGESRGMQQGSFGVGINPHLVLLPLM